MLSEYQLIQKIRDKACVNDKHGGCAQAVLASLQEELHIGDINTLKSATALPGGGGWRGETCGALLGGLMALGLQIGREKLDDTEKYLYTMDVSKEIISEFITELQTTFAVKDSLKSTLCWDIQKIIFGRSYNLAHQANRKTFLDDGGRTKKGCGTTCAIAAGVTARRLLKFIETASRENSSKEL